jgi:hypothetical protein
VRLVSRVVICLLLLLLLGGCTVVNSSHGVVLPANCEIAVLPLANNTETIQASASGTSIISHLLQARGLQVENYPMQCDSTDSCVATIKLRRDALAWAVRNKIPLVLSGSINEWRYKVGLDGEPVVSVSLNIIDMRRNQHQIVWSAVGSKVGSSRSSLGNTAQTLFGTMLNNVKWQ